LATLGSGFLVPLALSPVLASAVAVSIYLVLRFVRLHLGITKEWCVCIGETKEIVAVPQPNSVIALESAVPPTVTLSTGEKRDCIERYAGRFLGVSVQWIMDGVHVLSAGVVSFARG